MAKKLFGTMLGAFSPSGSTRPGSMPAPRPGTAGSSLVTQIRTTGSVRQAKASVKKKGKK